MSFTNGDLLFLVAVVLAVVVPITISVRAALRPEPVVVPVTRWPDVRRARRPAAPGYWPGVVVGIAGVYAIPILVRLVGAPAELAGVLLLAAFVLTLSIHIAAKPVHDFFGATAWGMVLGAFILPCFVGLIVLPLMSLVGL